MSSEISILNQGINITPDDTKVYGDLTLSDIKHSAISKINKSILLYHFGEKKIRNLDGNFVGIRIQEMINRTIFESGFKSDNLNLTELIMLIIKDVFSDFDFLTLSEVAYAYRKGIRGDYGKTYGLSVITFYSWLKEYNETTKTEAVKQLSLLKKELPPISNEKKIELRIKWLNNYIKDFEQYKSTKKVLVNDFSNLFYNYCINNGLCSLDKSEKAMLYQMAKDNELLIYSPKNATSLSQSREFKSLVSAITEDNIPQTIHEQITLKAKKLAIAMIFDKLIKNNLELKDLIAEVEKQV